jgi:hypothetical protein
MDIHGKTVALKPMPKFEKMKRVSARSSWMISDNLFDNRMKESCGVHPRG